jgi:hypothetical protein
MVHDSSKPFKFVALWHSAFIGRIYADFLKSFKWL